jgi:biotin operon repressor
MEELSSEQRNLLSLLMDAYPQTVPRGKLMRTLRINEDALRQLVYRLRKKGIKIKMVHYIGYGIDDDA